MPMKMRIALLSAMIVACLMIPAAESTIHIAQQGDVLWQISRSYKTPVTAVAEGKNVPSVDRIYVEQQLKASARDATTSYIVSPGDTLWLIAQDHGVTVPELLAVNPILEPNHIVVGHKMLIPAMGEALTTTVPEKMAVKEPEQEAVKTPAKTTAKTPEKDPVKTPVKTTAANTVTSRSSAPYSAAELDLFARLVHAESAGEPFQGQVAVAASILNRVRSSRYPNTLNGVIYQIEGGYYQYSPVLDGRINQPAGDSARRAVKEALSGSDPSKGALGFYNPRKTTNQWVRSQPVTTTIGNHVFFR
jgi:N-acetylmuramoyl-L-alanine amidase